MPSPHSLPFLVGPYECHRYLSGADPAELYLARDLRTGFQRTLKLLPLDRGADPQSVERLLVEANVACQCSHPNLIAAFEAGQADRYLFLATEYVPSKTLRAVIEQGLLPTNEDKIRVAVELARGLAYLHSQGIIHRDIKPENIFIDEAGTAKLGNFALARLPQQQITAEGQIIGTPLYLAPEQIRGDAPTPLIDVHSFGVTLFVLFTGSFPYRAVNREALYSAIVFEPPVLEPLDQKNVPPPVRQLIAQCLEKQPQSRPPSFTAILDRLATLQHQAPAPLPIQSPPPPPQIRQQPRRRKLWPRVLAAIVIGAAAGAALVFYLKNTNTAQPADGLPAAVEAKGGRMVLVPAGSARLGANQKQVSVPGFYIDRTEVSNETYGAFCRDTGRELPPDTDATRARFPVVTVSYTDASAFCAWAGKRLPTDIEWEKAARGAEGRTYPWGDETRPELANIPRGEEPRSIEPVESNFAGASPYGALNMLGNVWEWVDKAEPLEESDLRQYVMNPPVTRGEPAYQIRGGSFLQRIDLRQAVWDFATAPARLRRADIGFRCARSATATTAKPPQPVK